MEKLAGDLLFGLKFVKLSILPTLFIHFVQHRLGELRSRYLGIKGLTPSLPPFFLDPPSFLPPFRHSFLPSSLPPFPFSLSLSLSLPPPLPPSFFFSFFKPYSQPLYKIKLTVPANPSFLPSLETRCMTSRVTNPSEKVRNVH